MNFKEVIKQHAGPGNDLLVMVRSKTGHTDGKVVGLTELAKVLRLLKANRVVSDVRVQSDFKESITLILDGHILKRQAEGKSNKAWGFPLDVLRDLCKDSLVYVSLESDDEVYVLDSDMVVKDFYIPED